MTDSNRVMAPVEGKSARLFLVAGGLLVVFAANTGARAFADSGYPAVHSIFGPAGFFVGIVGLFGLYPALADRRPRLARVAALVAAIPAVGWFVITSVGIGNFAGVLPDASVVLPGGVPVVVFLTTVLTYLLFGTASLSTDVHSRIVGVLLLTPATVFLALIVGVAVLAASGAEGFEFALDSGHALAHLAIGVSLWTEGTPADRAEPAADATP